MGLVPFTPARKAHPMSEIQTYTMIAAVNDGLSCAIQPWHAKSMAHAEAAAANWLAHTDHGFTQAMITVADVSDWSVELIRDYVLNGAFVNDTSTYRPMFCWLLDHATPGTPEENLTIPHFIPEAWVGEEIEPTVDEVDLDNFVNRLEREFWMGPEFGI